MYELDRPDKVRFGLTWQNVDWTGQKTRQFIRADKGELH
jgi:hypothetical protein